MSPVRVRAAVVRLTLASMISGVVASAHELGTMRVAVEFSEGAYRIDIPVDPDVLLAKLEALARKPPSGELEDRRRLDRISDLRATFLEHAQVSFDDRRVTPRFEVTEMRAAEGSNVTRGAKPA